MHMSGVEEGNDRGRTRAALGAAAVLLVGEGHPEKLMRLGGDTSAANDTLGLLHTRRGSNLRCCCTWRDMPNAYRGEDLDGVSDGTKAGGVEGLEVENLNALKGTENLKTLETGGLVDVGGDLASLRTLAVDFGGGVVGAARGGGGDGAHGGQARRLEGRAGSEGGGAEGGGEHGFWRAGGGRRGEGRPADGRPSCRRGP